MLLKNKKNRGEKMKLTVLVDNNSIIDRYFLAEPGLSYYMEDKGKNILFDTGYSDVFLTNGFKLNLSFNNLDALVISHSHLDHTWGLESLIKYFTEQAMEGRSFNKPKLFSHPEIFRPKTFTGVEEFGVNVDEKKLFKYVSNNMSKVPKWVTNDLVFLGQIPRKFDFEKYSIGKVEINNELHEDFNIDDSALCYKSSKGLVIITGCSHSGICNIIEYAKEVCGEDKVYDVIGGFHLIDTPEDRLSKTVEYFKNLDIVKAHPCHCTDLKAKIALSEVVPVHEVGVGLQIKY